MKSTGVVRRIDELGRIVIPKEIRRNLGIRDGENVEIFTENDQIILKKYYRLNSNADLANSLCELTNNELNYNIIITNREKVIACKGVPEVLLNKTLNNDYLNIIEGREIVNRENYTLKLAELELTGNFIYIPIISLNDSIGLVIMYNKMPFINEQAIGKLIASIFARKLDI